MTRWRLLLLLLLVLISGSAGAALALATRDRPIQLPKPQDDPSRAALVAKEMDYSHYEHRLEEAVREPIPVTPMPSPHPINPAVPHDPEWDAFPRTSGFVKIVAAGNSLDVKQLFRNRDVNPTDTYLIASDRTYLTEVVARALANLSELGTISKEVAADEFEVLVRGGKTRSIIMADYIASLSKSERKEHDDRIAEFMKRKREAYEAQGLPAVTVEKMLAESQPVSYMPNKLFGKDVYATRSVEGKLLGATLSDLPKAAEALEVLNQRVIQMASDIVSIFVLRECIERSRADELLAATADTLTQRK